MNELTISAGYLNDAFITVAEFWALNGDERPPGDLEAWRPAAAEQASRMRGTEEAVLHLLGFRAVLDSDGLLGGYRWGSGQYWDWEVDADLVPAVMRVFVEELDKVVPDDAIDYPVSVTVTDGPGPVLDAPL